jgi:hypothetical protein
MQSALNTPPVTSSNLEMDQTFNVVTAYEDFDTGTHAKKTYDFLVENLRPESQFTNQMWKFDVLTIPKLREIAVKDALEADIIIISTHGGAELPVQIRDWIESWLLQKSGAIALVALFDCPPEHTGPIRAYLAEVAKRGEMELFAQPDHWPGRLLQLGHSSHPISLRTERALSTLMAVADRDEPALRWGLNE